jgi:hypothetical protein
VSASRCSLETMSERVEDTCFVRNAEPPLVPAEPFRPQLAEAILATGSEKGEKASLLADRTYPVYEPQKSNAGQRRMYGHQPGRAGGLETAPLLLVLFDVYGDDIRCCIRYHIRCRQWCEFIKPRPGEQGHQRQPECRFSLSGCRFRAISPTIPI